MFAFYVCMYAKEWYWIEAVRTQTQIHKAHKRARFTFAKYQKSKSNLFDGLCALCVRVFFLFTLLNSFRFDVSFSFARVFLSIILTLFHTLCLSLFFHRKKNVFCVCVRMCFSNRAHETGIYSRIFMTSPLLCTIYSCTRNIFWSLIRYFLKFILNM